MLGASQADATSAVLASAHGVFRVIGIGPDIQLAELIRPRQQFHQPGIGDVGNHGLQLSQIDFAGGAIDGDPVSFLDDFTNDRHLSLGHVDIEGGYADDGRGAELAGDESGMAGAAATAGQDTLGSEHAMNVVRFGLGANHDHGFAIFFRPGFGQIGVESDHANSRARRHIQTCRQQITFFLKGFLGFGVELRVQEEIDLLGCDAHDSFFLGDEAFVDHIRGDADRSLGGALAIAGLEHPQFVSFDSEFHILHFSVMLFQTLADCLKLGPHVGHIVGQLAHPIGDADTGHHIFALGIDQIIALDVFLAGGGVTGHGHASGAALAHVAEHHGLDIDAGAQVMGDLGGIAIIDSAFAVPGLEHSLGRQFELLIRICGEIDASVLFEKHLEFFADSFPILGCQISL